MSAADSPTPTRAALVALTREAEAALGSARLDLASFPFRVGRESRSATWTPGGLRAERRKPGASAPNNDLYLPDREEPLNVSREHFQIERDGADYLLVDCQSTCGTIVEGARVGGQTEGGSAPLRDGDVIIVGTSRSPFIFKFRVSG